ncbi:hypothetical protein AVEN_228286-1 [Araneus ventricosus]|uniref:Uncharacterized protein n=1 Tax=Araneus ventricosus TaxID=182803 RepID=A0A4Y2E9G4_ARAVE|nr:hypothetical protein AVEN_228286-1 [Araneus ventricosus]
MANSSWRIMLRHWILQKVSWLAAVSLCCQLYFVHERSHAAFGLCAGLVERHRFFDVYGFVVLLKLYGLRLLADNEVNAEGQGHNDRRHSMEYSSELGRIVKTTGSRFATVVFPE